MSVYMCPRVLGVTARVPCSSTWFSQLSWFGMEAGLADLVLLAFVSIGFGALLRPSATAPAPAVVFCDRPSVASWLAAGLAVGFGLGVLFVVTLAAFLRPPAVVASSSVGRASGEVTFYDAEERLAPPRATYG